MRQLRPAGPTSSCWAHLGFVTEPVFQRFASGVTECLQAWLAGQPLVRVITGDRA